MKRYIIVLLALVLLASQTALSASAVGELGTPDDSCFTYELTDSSATITAYSGTAANVAIPNSVNGIPVTSIADGVFASHTELLRVYLPDGLQSIGADAFSGCTSLLTLTLPDSLTTLGDGAFSGCTSLYDIAPGTGLLSIGARAFHGCAALPGVTLPRSLSSIGSAAFADCAELTAVVLLSDTALSLPADIVSDSPNAVVYSTVATDGAATASAYGNGAEISYKNVSGGIEITSCRTTASALVLPDNIGSSRVISIGDGALRNGCASLRAVVLPSGLTTIGNAAFSGLAALEYVRMPERLTVGMGSECFSGCSSLRSMVLPSGLTTIGLSCFLDCSSLTLVALPQELSRILSGAFARCTALSTIYLYGDEPECLGKNGSVTSQAFGGVSDNARVYVPAGRKLASASKWYANGSSSAGFAITVLADNCFYAESAYLAPTCHSEGTRRFECPFCGLYFEHTLSRTAHEYVSVGVADGYETFRCLNCVSNYLKRRIEACSIEPEINLSASGVSMIKSIKLTFGDTLLVHNTDYTYEVVHNKKNARLEVTVTGIGSCTGSATWGFSAYTGEALMRFDVVSTSGDIAGLGEYYRDDTVTLTPSTPVPEGYEVIWTLEGVSSSECSGNSISFSMPAHTVSASYTLRQKPIETTTEPPVTEPPVTEPPITEPPVTEPPVTDPPVTTTRPPYDHTQQGEQYLRTAVLWGLILFASLAAFVALCIVSFKKKKD